MRKRKQYPLWVSVDDVTYITFRVKGCSDAIMTLAESYGVTSDCGYEIIIGEKRNSMYGYFDIIKN